MFREKHGSYITVYIKVLLFTNYIEYFPCRSFFYDNIPFDHSHNKYQILQLELNTSLVTVIKSIAKTINILM